MRLIRHILLALFLLCPSIAWSAYIVETTDNLTKWWFTGTGSTVNRLSELRDDCPDGPYLDTGDIGAWAATGNPSEWTIGVGVIPNG